MTFKNIHIVLVLLSAIAGSVYAQPSDAKPMSRNDIKQMVIEESSNSRVPPALALAVAKVESDFSADALSTAGARGVMQIMPKTARDEFGVDEDELWNPRLNIQLGIDFLAKLYQQYDRRWDLALSHYNGGTLKGQGGRAKPHSFTRQYVDSVLRWQQRYEDQSSIWMVASNDVRAKDKDRRRDRDGWTPAKKRVKKRLGRSLKRDQRSASKQDPAASDGWDRRPSRYGKKRGWGKSRRRNSGSSRIWVSWGDESRRSHRFDGNFKERLQRARDLGPAPSWRRG